MAEGLEKANGEVGWLMPEDPDALLHDAQIRLLRTLPLKTRFPPLEKRVPSMRLEQEEAWGLTGLAARRYLRKSRRRKMSSRPRAACAFGCASWERLASEGPWYGSLYSLRRWARS